MQLQPDHAQRSDSKLYSSVTLARVDWPLIVNRTLTMSSERSECANHEEHLMHHKDLVAPAVAMTRHGTTTQLRTPGCPHYKVLARGAVPGAVAIASPRAGICFLWGFDGCRIGTAPCAGIPIPEKESPRASIVVISQRPPGQFIMPFMRVIAGRICLLMIFMRSETVLYGLIDAMK